VAAVLAVLAGESVPAVARRWSVDTALLHRWVRAFVDAGSAQVTNRPDPEAAQQRDRFLAAFAHEMRTPLAIAKGWAAVLADGDLPPDQLVSTVARLEQSLARLTERTLDVELLAAASLGRLRLSPALVSVGELSDGLPDVGTVGGEGPDVEVVVDPELFRRVLRDLWDAGGSLPTPRALRLEVAVVAPWTELRVVRDADPIDTRLLQALFEPFDLNDDGTGVTIGLYLARALAVAHGGAVGVEQDGTRGIFWVRVPHGASTSGARTGVADRAVVLTDEPRRDP
jgi:signal transduction histidine kinase